MLRHFPIRNVAYAHRKRDYFIAAFTFFCVAICLISDANESIEKQNGLGVSVWVYLIGLLLGENREVRMQVIIAVILLLSANILHRLLWVAIPTGSEMYRLMCHLVTEWFI